MEFVNKLSTNAIEDVYKHEHIRIRAILLRLLGSQHLLLVDDILQDTCVKAISSWPAMPNGAPENPAAWLTLTAKRSALDVLRGQKVRQQYANMIKISPLLASGWTASAAINEQFEFAMGQSIEDEQLRILVWLCTSKLNQKYLIPIILKHVCGLPADAIGKAMLLSSVNIKKRITRATKALREHSFEKSFETVNKDAKANLHKILYLLFNEGLNAKEGQYGSIPIASIEAFNLMKVVAHHKVLKTSESGPLLTLMYLYMARIHTRFDKNSIPVPLNLQDRQQWRTHYLVKGCDLLNGCLDNKDTHNCPYLYEALIAQEHLKAATFDETHWLNIVNHYRKWLTLFEHPVAQAPMVLLNMSIAMAHNGNPIGAIDLLREVGANKHLQGDYQTQATAAYIYALAGNIELAEKHFSSAKNKGMNPEELTALQKQIQLLLSYSKS